MYGENYGYRSSLNRSMVRHLEQKSAALQSTADLADGDLVLDIGSNDGTFLSFFPSRVKRVGMDPSAAQLCDSYDKSIQCVVDYFSGERFAREFGSRKAKVITSIAMFYDLETPQQFVNDVAECLDDEGIWHFEQSYLPLMLDVTGYDTICHEHLEYYALSQVEWMLERAGLRVIDVDLNQINGGSFAVTASKAHSSHSSNSEKIGAIKRREDQSGLRTEGPYRQFRERVHDHKTKLVDLIGGITESGGKVIGYGASTKGNVMLQFCGFTPAQISCIAEVNADKFGCFTPGTLIPIVSEEKAHAMEPDYFLVMPWHFRANLLEREAGFLANGGKMIFPLPKVDIVGRPIP
jgi:cyclopropane fatty-acyl-phospholipid synthase-like methyltransferase